MSPDAAPLQPPPRTPATPLLHAAAPTGSGGGGALLPQLVSQPAAAPGLLALVPAPPLPGCCCLAIGCRRSWHPHLTLRSSMLHAALLAGGTIGFFQSLCLLGYCLFPMVVASIVCATVNVMLAR